MSKALVDLGAERVILIGSLARGRADELTDVDLIAVLETHLPFVERSAWVYGALVPRVDADIIVYTPEEFERMSDEPFLRRALAEGVVLYEKGTA
ncbi:MAG: nucleotidyltransferase domain-containing protein [Ignavibacteriales bacterium]